MTAAAPGAEYDAARYGAEPDKGSSNDVLSDWKMCWKDDWAPFSWVSEIDVPNEPVADGEEARANSTRKRTPLTVTEPLAPDDQYFHFVIQGQQLRVRLTNNIIKAAL